MLVTYGWKIEFILLFPENHINEDWIGILTSNALFSLKKQEKPPKGRFMT